jgi:hypothetical protein
MSANPDISGPITAGPPDRAAVRPAIAAANRDLASAVQPLAIAPLTGIRCQTSRSGQNGSSVKDGRSSTFEGISTVLSWQ